MSFLKSFNPLEVVLVRNEVGNVIYNLLESEGIEYTTYPGEESGYEAIVTEILKELGKNQEDKKMARTREIACIHYKCEHNCDLGKDACFRGLCQTCPTYKKLPGGKPARVDNRRKKMDKIIKRERY